jgi:alpha,alpha-trehalase
VLCLFQRETLCDFIDLLLLNPYERRISMTTLAFTIHPSTYDAIIFDLDGVVTKTAEVHAAAWKQMFDEYLERRGERDGKSYEPFDRNADYRRYVDGKPRYDGVKSFMESRSIDLPYGDPDDEPGEETICGLGNRKNELFNNLLEKGGAPVFQSTVDLIHTLRDKGFKIAVASSSQNCAAVLQAAHLPHLFEANVAGVDLAELGLDGKPAPDMFLEAARRLGVDPHRAVVVEDAIAGVEAGRRGNFACVVGVDREDETEALQERGAQVVVKDLAEIQVAGEDESNTAALPSALAQLEEIQQRGQGKRMAVFLDYDGTLTPIVESPEEAVLSADMRSTIEELANHCTVAIVSGRDLKDVRDLVDIDSIYYAGSHGFDIAGPKGHKLESQQGTEFLPILDTSEQALRNRLADVPGSLVERKKFSIAIHYRKVPDDRVAEVETAVDEVLSTEPELRKSTGKKVFELQPKIDWHKGKALLWLLEKLELDGPDVLPLYIGDDTTDEDAFRTLKDRGLAIVVEEGSRSTEAHYRLANPAEVQVFLQKLTSMLKGGA